MKVSVQEPIEALARHIKMLRGPQGARGKGLKEAAFMLELNRMWVYVPGGRHFIVSLEDELKEEVLFEAKRLLSIQKAPMSLSPEQHEIELVI